MQNLKTTAAGIAGVLTGLAMIAHAFTSDTVDMNQVGAGIAAVATGIGLIFAKDSGEKK